MIATIFSYLAFSIAMFFVISNTLKKKKESVSVPSENKIGRKTIIDIILAVVFSRMILLVICWIITSLSGNARDLFSVWNSWDATNYLSIAQDGYLGSEGWIFIVFYPLYPSVVGIINATIGNINISAMFVSWSCLVIACVYMYKMIMLDHNDATARRAVKYLLIFPVTVFLGAPYTESMFIALCCSCIYYVRIHKFWAAGICGLLATLSRNLGLLLVVPMIIEILNKYEYKIKAKELWKDALNLLPLIAGALAYLILNHLLTGNAFSFLEYQSDHWNQRFGSFDNTLRTTWGMLSSVDTENMLKFVLFLPQFATLIVGGIGLVYVCKKQYCSYGAYSWAYLFVAFAPTWLLSGMRYIMGMFTIYPMLAVLAKNKKVDIVLTAVFIVLAILFAGLYSVGQYVM